MNRLLLLSMPLIVTLAGCGGETSSLPARANYAYTVDLASRETNLKTLNGGARVAGWNRLTGTTTVAGDATEVEMQANVDYTDGSGSFFGFVTTTASDGSLLAMRRDGIATKDAASGDTSFRADLSVVGGTGGYAIAEGRGTFTGSRSTALGGKVHLALRTQMAVSPGP